MENKRIIIPISEEIVKKIDEKALSEDRSRASLIRFILKNSLEGKS